MRRSAQQFAERRHMPFIAHATLYGLSKFYQAGANIRKLPYTLGLRKPRQLRVPTISVGNVTWGGTGKTPMVEYLCKEFLAQGKHPVVFMQNYGNDEMHQLVVRLPEVGIAAAKDREKLAVEVLEKYSHLDVAILDDGLQQQRIKPNLSIVMMNTFAAFGNGYLIPRGSLREPPIPALRRSDVAVLHNYDLATDEERAEAHQLLNSAELPSKMILLKSAFVPTKMQRYSSARPPSSESLETLRQRHIVAFAGIGNPLAFERRLQKLTGRPVQVMCFPDHHPFTTEDVNRIRRAGSKHDALFVTTQKDFMRQGCADLTTALGAVRVIEGELRLLAENGAQVRSLTELFRFKDKQV